MFGFMLNVPKECCQLFFAWPISSRVSLDFRPKLSSPNNGYMLRSMFTVLILGGRGKIHKLTYLPHMHDSLPFSVMMSMFHFCSVTERYGKMNHHQSVNQYAYWNFSEELCRTPRKHQQENRCEKCLYNFWYSCHTSKASDRVQPYSIFY